MFQVLDAGLQQEQLKVLHSPELFVCGAVASPVRCEVVSCSCAVVACVVVAQLLSLAYKVSRLCQQPQILWNLLSL